MSIRLNNNDESRNYDERPYDQTSIMKCGSIGREMNSTSKVKNYSRKDSSRHMR